MDRQPETTDQICYLLLFISIEGLEMPLCNKSFHVKVSGGEAIDCLMESLFYCVRKDVSLQSTPELTIKSAAMLSG